MFDNRQAAGDRVGFHTRLNGTDSISANADFGATSVTLTKTGYTTGVWYFVVAVLNRSTCSFELYVNNVLVDSADITSLCATSITSAEVPLVGKAMSGEIFDGNIDDLRVYNRALTTNEISRLYGLGATTRVAETVTSNTSLETGLLGHWTFDGGDMQWSSTTAEVLDVSGHQNSGDAQGGLSSVLSSVPGAIGQALDISVDGQLVNVGNSSLFDNIGNGSNGTGMTFVSWIYPRSQGELNAGKIFVKGGGGSGSPPPSGGWDVRMSSTNSVNFAVQYDGVTDLDVETLDNSIALDTWQQVVVTWDGSANNTGVSLYINAIPQTLTDLFDGAGSRVSDVGLNGYIGNSNSGGRTFDGSIDDVRLYNRILSQEEIRRLYDLGIDTRVSETPKSTTLDTGLMLHYTFDGPYVDWSSTTAEVRDVSGNNRHGDATSTMASEIQNCPVLSAKRLNLMVPPMTCGPHSLRITAKQVMHFG